MNLVKVFRDSLFATFLLVLLIVMSWATPFGFMGAEMVSTLGMFMLFIFVFLELMFLSL